MVNYSDAKIYRVIDNSTGLQYIGSTTQSLAKRMYEHRQKYKRWVELGQPRGKGSKYTTSFELFETGNEVTIELVEKPEVTCREELGAREGHWIRELDCVNKVVVGRTGKEYREANKEVRNARNKEYREANKEEIYAKAKEWREANKERERTRHKEYYEANKERERARQKEW